ncbi:hypothetical protein SISSUDRAFT_1038675 [Sistotremastrum suecicum HHB10207 ss-3]|uniref:Uncharacterized protein n=1 Tax=Sistotremastrum suecicum HHB10207 ss-3 TaxID=1314776 RepID=A0A165WGK9_9AGAM|nr:hypothetical protein SISSUDRAFT_1038675 [Sistotremastrum suecicum HHB10207 ss-3]
MELYATVPGREIVRRYLMADGWDCIATCDSEDGSVEVEMDGRWLASAYGCDVFRKWISESFSLQINLVDTEELHIYQPVAQMVACCGRQVMMLHWPCCDARDREIPELTGSVMYYDEGHLLHMEHADGTGAGMDFTLRHALDWIDLVNGTPELW